MKTAHPRTHHGTDVMDPASADQTQSMRVLMVSTSYPADAADWRGTFIRNLAAAIARAGDIRLSLWAPPGELPPAVAAVALPQESAWLARLMAAGGISHLMRARPASIFAPIKLLRLLAAAYRRCHDVDIYHINWLQCALPLPDNGVPALINVLGNDLRLLRLPGMRRLLRRVMHRRRVVIAPNAGWMLEPLQAAFGDLATIAPVSFGIDERWYTIGRETGWQKPIWLAITRLTADKLGPLFQWSEHLFAEGRRELHLFGPMQEEIAVPQWVHFHGPVTPQELATQWFPRACGLVTLSRHAEGRPQVMLEAMAAGLPIVASRMPAHSSVVFDGQTGILCGTASEYVAALEALETPATNRCCGAAARAWAQQHVGTWDDCADRYARIYLRMLATEIDA
jgi:hypothetical protein